MFSNTSTQQQTYHKKQLHFEHCCKATKEAPIQQGIKDAIVKADERGTTLVMRSLKNTERVFKNKASTEVRKREAASPGKIEAIYDLVKGDNYRKSFHETGDTENSVWSCGQVIGLIDDIPDCKTLVANIVNEAAEVLGRRLPPMLSKM